MGSEQKQSTMTELAHSKSGGTNCFLFSSLFCLSCMYLLKINIKKRINIDESECWLNMSPENAPDCLKDWKFARTTKDLNWQISVINSIVYSLCRLNQILREWHQLGGGTAVTVYCLFWFSVAGLPWSLWWWYCTGRCTQFRPTKDSWNFWIKTENV